MSSNAFHWGEENPAEAGWGGLCDARSQGSANRGQRCGRRSMLVIQPPAKVTMVMVWGSPLVGR